MKKASLSLIFLLIAALLYPQDFFHGAFDRSRNYVILMNPTAGNLEVVDFLVKDFGRNFSLVFIEHPVISGCVLPACLWPEIIIT